MITPVGRTYARMLLAVLLSGLFWGCGTSREGWPEDAPVIACLESNNEDCSGVTYLDQSPVDPYGLMFEIQFMDKNGDLGSGKVHLLMADQEEGSRDLSEIFAAEVPPIALDAIQGAFEIIVRVEGRIEIGDELRIGFFLTDAAGNKSNEPWVQLQAFPSGGG